MGNSTGSNPRNIGRSCMRTCEDYFFRMKCAARSSVRRCKEKELGAIDLIVVVVVLVGLLVFEMGNICLEHERAEREREISGDFLKKQMPTNFCPGRTAARKNIHDFFFPGRTAPTTCLGWSVIRSMHPRSAEQWKASSW
jgi:hypothetical protein